MATVTTLLFLQFAPSATPSRIRKAPAAGVRTPPHGAPTFGIARRPPTKTTAVTPAAQVPARLAPLLPTGPRLWLLFLFRRGLRRRLNIRRCASDDCYGCSASYARRARDLLIETFPASSFSVAAPPPNDATSIKAPAAF